MPELVQRAWPIFLAALNLAVALLASAHVILNKRDPRAAIGWLVIIWLAPLAGATAYALLGVNRIRRRARALDRARIQEALPPPEAVLEEDEPLLPLARLTNRVARRPLLRGNAVTPLDGGDAAYPEMLTAIDGARETLTLSTYIFDADPVGREFVDALARAKERGVEVRVLIDAVGLRYSWPSSMLRALRRRGVRAERFLPTWLPWRLPYMNLRMHKKTLVVDGRVGFTGGMNLRVGHALSRQPLSPVRDVHFRLEGPVVAHLQASFREDWRFTTDEDLEGEAWFPPLEEAGPLVARGINDGPDEDFEKLRWTFLGGLFCARRRVRIVTPYFLPDASLLGALSGAAMRGVDVEVVLPERGNLRLPQWASRALLWQIVQAGCRVLVTPPPFDHSKLMVVDDDWSLIGSGNWDPRSFRLSFELNVECYGTSLVEQVDALIDERIREAHELTLEELDGRSIPVRLRDGAARLLSPYL